jgi:hypothetical protein
MNQSLVRRIVCRSSDRCSPSASATTHLSNSAGSLTSSGPPQCRVTVGHAAIEELVTVFGPGTVARGCGYDLGFLDVESVRSLMNTLRLTIINPLAQASSVADAAAR